MIANGKKMVISTYILGRKLGQGANAVVHEVTADQGQRYAAKMILKKNLKGDQAKLKITQEVKLHKMCRHNNIIQIQKVFDDDEYIYIILDICSNLTLLDLVDRRKQLDELEVQCYVR